MDDNNVIASQGQGVWTNNWINLQKCYACGYFLPWAPVVATDNSTLFRLSGTSNYIRNDNLVLPTDSIYSNNSDTSGTVYIAIGSSDTSAQPDDKSLKSIIATSTNEWSITDTVVYNTEDQNKPYVLSTVVATWQNKGADSVQVNEWGLMGAFKNGNNENKSVLLYREVLPQTLTINPSDTLVFNPITIKMDLSNPDNLSS